MSNQKSWDGFASIVGGVSLGEGSGYTRPVRVVPWPKGCPYSPSQVPQVGEEVDVGAVVTVMTPPYYDGTKAGHAHLPTRGAWTVVVAGSGGVTTEEPLSFVARSSSVLEVGGKRYREKDVVERCRGLEEVE